MVPSTTSLLLLVEMLEHEALTLHILSTRKLLLTCPQTRPELHLETDYQARTRDIRESSSVHLSMCTSTHHPINFSEPLQNETPRPIESSARYCTHSFVTSQHVDSAFFVRLAFQDSLLRVHGDWYQHSTEFDAFLTKNVRQK